MNMITFTFIALVGAMGLAELSQMDGFPAFSDRVVERVSNL